MSQSGSALVNRQFGSFPVSGHSRTIGTNRIVELEVLFCSGYLCCGYSYDSTCPTCNLPLTPSRSLRVRVEQITCKPKNRRL
jgi:hypothetical protein